jgi:hypothetical protein
LHCDETHMFAFAGCCFVKYATSEEADRAIRALHNQWTIPGVTSFSWSSVWCQSFVCKLLTVYLFLLGDGPSSG